VVFDTALFSQARKIQTADSWSEVRTTRKVGQTLQLFSGSALRQKSDIGTLVFEQEIF